MKTNDELKLMYPMGDPAKGITHAMAGKTKNGDPARRPEGWFHGRIQFSRHLGPEVKLILEIGTWKGLSAVHWLKECPNADLICLDTWEGSPDHLTGQLIKQLPNLYDTFLANLDLWKDRVIPMKMQSLLGIHLIHEYGLKPDLIYLDANHGMWPVFADLLTLIKFFPDSQIIGDDWGFKTVREGVTQALASLGMGNRLVVEDAVWSLKPIT